MKLFGYLAMAIVGISATGRGGEKRPGMTWGHHDTSQPLLGRDDHDTKRGTDTNAPGAMRSDKGCLGSAGYQWCAAKQKCHRTWEEDCEDPTIAALAGTYVGSTTVLGVDATVTMAIKDSSHTDFALKTNVDMNIDCENEAYKLDGANLVLVNSVTAGDCVHDAMAANSVVLQGSTYDAAKNEITLSVEVSTLPVTIVLTQVAAVASINWRIDHGKKAKHSGPKMGAHERVAAPQAAMSGTYVGDKTVLGIHVEGTMVIDDSAHADFAVTDSVGADVDCKDEEFSMSGSEIKFSGIDTDGDCVHDALAEEKITFKSATYDADKDEITVNVKYDLLKLSIVLTKQAKLIGGGGHDMRPHTKPAIGGDDHDMRPHTKPVIGGDDHDMRPHSPPNAIKRKFLERLMKRSLCKACSGKKGACRDALSEVCRMSNMRVSYCQQCTEKDAEGHHSDQCHTAVREYLSGCQNPQEPQEEARLIGARDGLCNGGGYTWCEAKQKCLRVWEEKCEAPVEVETEVL